MSKHKNPKRLTGHKTSSYQPINRMKMKESETAKFIR